MDRNKIINIVCVGVILVCGVGIGVMVPGVVERLSKNDEPVGQGGEQLNSSSCAKLPEITSLTKGEALDVIDSAFSGDVYVYTLCDFAPKNIIGASDIFRTGVDTADFSNVAEMKEVESSDEYLEVLDVDKSDDRYIVKTSMEKLRGEFGGTSSGKNRTVIFDKADLDYYDSGAGIIFRNKDKKFVEDALRIFASTLMASEWSGRPPSNLYSYRMEDKDGAYEFAYYYVAIGMDVGSSTFDGGEYKLVYQLNLVQLKYRVDKATGAFEKVRNVADDGYMEILKSYALSDEEAAKYMGSAG